MSQLVSVRDRQQREKQFNHDECVAHAMQALKTLGFSGIVQHKAGAFGFTPTTPAEFSAVIRCETAVKTVFFVVTGIEQSDETVRIL
jgi:hypothetical protein